MTYKWQSQLGPKLCMPTAISILTEIPVWELVQAVGGNCNRSYSADEFITPLFRRGWLFSPAYSGYFLDAKEEVSAEIILTTCPSVVSGILLDSEVLEESTRYHAIAWTGTSVIDPGAYGEKSLHKIFKSIEGVAPIVEVPKFKQYWTNLQSEVPDWL